MVFLNRGRVASAILAVCLMGCWRSPSGAKKVEAQAPSTPDSSPASVASTGPDEELIRTADVEACSRSCYRKRQQEARAVTEIHEDCHWACVREFRGTVELRSLAKLPAAGSLVRALGRVSPVATDRMYFGDGTELAIDDQRIRRRAAATATATSNGRRWAVVIGHIEGSGAEARLKPDRWTWLSKSQPAE